MLTVWLPYYIDPIQAEGVVSPLTENTTYTSTESDTTCNRILAISPLLFQLLDVLCITASKPRHR
jgi:hypothetical protein